jgi:hypothetical protein
MSRETFAGIRIWQNNPVDNERAPTSCSPDEVREVLQQIVGDRAPQKTFLKGQNSMVTLGAFPLQSSCELTRTLGLARGGISDDHTRGISG